MQRTLGWRHFHITDKRKAGGETFVCMVSTCNNDTKLWLNSSVLKGRCAPLASSLAAHSRACLITGSFFYERGERQRRIFQP